jgi:hypothetical protein
MLRGLVLDTVSKLKSGERLAGEGIGLCASYGNIFTKILFCTQVKAIKAAATEGAQADQNEAMLASKPGSVVDGKIHSGTQYWLTDRFILLCHSFIDMRIL